MFNLIPKIPEAARSKKATAIISCVIFLAFGLLVAPIVAAAITGLAGFVTALVIGYTSFKAAPWFSMMVTNFFLKAIKAEARRNPVETMQALYIERQQKVGEAREKVKNFNTSVNLYSSQVDKFALAFPQDKQKFQDHLEAMRTLLKARYGALTAAQAELEKYHHGIQRASAIWEMTKASDSLSEAAGKLTEADAISRIKHDEALLSIEEGMARSMAELDHLLTTEVSTNPEPAESALAQLAKSPDGINGGPYYGVEDFGASKLPSIRDLK